MSEWWTYTLSDIAMFTRQTYYRLFELYNSGVWPAHVAALGGGLFLWRLMQRRGPSAGRLAAGILAACWAWVAIAFHATRYATIHWAGVYFAAAFGSQAALLLWTALRGRPDFGSRAETVARVGRGIFLFALFVQPLAGLLFGRGWRQIEVFGVAPDPTAVATLGVVLSAAGRTRWELVAIPLLWCAVSGATLAAIEAPDAWVAPLAAVLVILLATWRTLADRRRPSPSRADHRDA